MGNSISNRQPQPTAKVILSDGSVHEFDNPLTVAELMLEHPQQVVVEFQSAVTGKRPNPLPADKNLEMKKIYLMLPTKRGKPKSLSSEEIRGVILIANSILRSRSLVSSSKFLPFFARICPPSTVVDGQSFVLPKKENVQKSEVIRNVSEFLPESMGGRPEFLIRQCSGKGWKPSLDTINEKEMKVEKKVSHWLF
ncbi:uncharacterized protein LOC107426357 [Ziziphus jujuba]|uniref:Uncharacterized protein LOC107426357 n=2 Tax=Ziziphus jujuba TaxID=326968 RepID=A0A6P4B0B4_ZIZJJ|nr:uncharacterized protein LOC107426357 [Ziziphus jujuba]KAH7516982.1 hypothetical protein FEM48_Zijuj09G0013800 [Ziziphus jujuba var. spinosa]